jgi:hypothetical protein
MKYLKTFAQLNEELQQLHNYDAISFMHEHVSNAIKTYFDQNIKGKKKYFSPLSAESRKGLIEVATNSLLNSILEYYGIENNPENVKKILSLFKFKCLNIRDDRFRTALDYMDVLNIGGYSRTSNVFIIDVSGTSINTTTDNYHDPKTGGTKLNNLIIDIDEAAGYQSGLYGFFFENLKVNLEFLIKKIEEKFPEEKADKLALLLPYKKSKIETDDKLVQNINDWQFTFETIKKLLYEFAYNPDNVTEEQMKDFSGIFIDECVDLLEEIVKNHDYSTEIVFGTRSYENSYKLTNLDESRITDQQYMKEYMFDLRNLLVTYFNDNGSLKRNTPFFEEMHEYINNSNLKGDSIIKFKDLLALFVNWIPSGPYKYPFTRKIPNFIVK